MEGWEDQIDVDDSDLHSVLRPQLLPSSSSLQTLTHCLHPCSQIPSSCQTLNRIPSIPPPQSQILDNISEKNQNEELGHLPKLSTSRPLIPGPAGAIQVAMRRQSAEAASKRNLLEEKGSDDLDLCVREEDEDFELNPWLYALSFLGKRTDSSLPYSISSINAQRCAAKRIPQVVGIVKSCTPNRLGDLFITLKDPTGTIGAAIHRRVLSEGSGCGEISVGCVFILKQVVAFCPARFSCYLNITVKNVVKLIPKDCGPLEKQIKYGAELNERQLQTKPSKITAVVEPIRNFACEMATNGRTVEPSRLISKASVAGWTDEQLGKLFSDYEDDVDLVLHAI